MMSRFRALAYENIRLDKARELPDIPIHKNAKNTKTSQPERDPAEKE